MTNAWAGFLYLLPWLKKQILLELLENSVVYRHSFSETPCVLKGCLVSDWILASSTPFHFFSKCQMGHADVVHPPPRSRQEWDEQKWSMAPVEQLFKIAGEETTTSPASTPAHLLSHHSGDSSLGSVQFSSVQLLSCVRLFATP